MTDDSTPYDGRPLDQPAAQPAPPAWPAQPAYAGQPSGAVAPYTPQAPAAFGPIGQVRSTGLAMLLYVRSASSTSVADSVLRSTP